MSRTIAELPAGSRITDHISLGVIARTFPVERVRAVLAATAKASVRERDLPAHVVVYYVIALALYMQSSYREVLLPAGGSAVVAGAVGEGQSGGQFGNLTGANQTGMGAVAATAR